MKVTVFSAGVLVNLLCLVPSAGAGEARRDASSQLVAMATRMIAAANAGDVTAMASMVADTDHTIIDNFLPFIWTGTSALSLWLDDSGRNSEASGITETRSRLGATKFMRIEDDRAYVTVEDFYSYKRKGKAVREDLLWTFVAIKTDADWKLVSWSFSGGAKH